MQLCVSAHLQKMCDFSQMLRACNPKTEEKLTQIHRTVKEIIRYTEDDIKQIQCLEVYCGLLDFGEQQKLSADNKNYSKQGRSLYLIISGVYSLI